MVMNKGEYNTLQTLKSENERLQRQNTTQLDLIIFLRYLVELIEDKYKITNEEMRELRLKAKEE